MWEERFATTDYIFGTEPSQFLLEHQVFLIPGQSVLAVADGEGRNSVYMAEKGMDATAVEFAPSAVAKARKLARDRGVDVEFVQADLLNWEWPVATYDLVAGILIQFTGPDARDWMFRQMADAVKPGGLLMLHGYTPKQVDYGTGGPPFRENMYTETMLASAFDGWRILENRAYERENLRGMAAMIDFIARKPGSAGETSA